MLLCLPIVLGLTVFPQDPLRVLQPLQPVPAFLAQPVSASIPEGQWIQVVDEDQQPVPKASVFVADWANLADVDRDAARHFYGDDAPIWLSARAGTRFLTDANGAVRVPKLPGATIGAIHPETGAVALCLVGTRIRLRGRRVPFRVEVLDADGRPSSGVPVVIGRGHGDRFGEKFGALTDALGRVTLPWQTEGERADDLQVQVTCVDGPTTAARVPWPAEGAAAPMVQLRLPPVVGVRLQLRDERGQPVSHSQVTAIGHRFGGATKAVRVEGDAYFVWPIAPGGAVRLEMRHAGATGARQVHVLEAPSAAGSVATVTLAIELPPPAVPDPRLAAALRQLGVAPPARALPEGGMPHVVVPAGQRQAGANQLGRVHLALDPALATIDALTCELRRRTASAGLGDPIHRVLERQWLAGASPGVPALLGRTGTSYDLTSHALGAVDAGAYQLRVLLGPTVVQEVANVDVLAGKVTTVVQLPAAPLPTRNVWLVDHEGKPTPGALVVQGHARQRVATRTDGAATVPHVAGVHWLATAPQRRSRLLPAGGADDRIDVVLEPRCRVRVVVPRDVVVPDGVVLCFANLLDPELATWEPFRHGSDNLVAPDASGTVSVSLWLQREGQPRVPLELAWPLQLPAGDREVTFELPLDAEQLERIGAMSSRR